MGHLEHNVKAGLPRPTWHEYFMKITNEVASRSTCRRRQCGAVIVMNERILSTGYNGIPTGLVHCLERGCLREDQDIESGQRHELCRGLHAEQNALLQAALYGVKIKDAIIYSTHQPCSLCSKMIINCGIKKIYYQEGYPDLLAEELIVEAKIEAIRLSDIKS